MQTHATISYLDIFSAYTNNILPHTYIHTYTYICILHTCIYKHNIWDGHSQRDVHHFLADNSGIIRDERCKALAGPATQIVLQNPKPGSIEWAGREVEAEHGPHRQAASRLGDDCRRAASSALLADDCRRAASR
jgi:hypothetical protein